MFLALNKWLMDGSSSKSNTPQNKELEPARSLYNPIGMRYLNANIMHWLPSSQGGHCGSFAAMPKVSIEQIH